jgi:hypothetical protein
VRKMTRTLYTAKDFPAFQNRMYDSSEEAVTGPKGQIELVEDLRSGLVRNVAFDPSLLVYDTAYQNEQANSTAKQGKYLAGTGLRVNAPEDILPNLPPEARIMIMNPNYSEEIRTMSGNTHTYVEVGA